MLIFINRIILTPNKENVSCFLIIVLFFSFSFVLLISYDKQFVRNYLISVNFDMKTPMELPSDLVETTREKYIQIFIKLTGHQPDLN